MKKIYTIILFLTTLGSFSQNSSCSFSDGNYHYLVSLNIVETPSTTYNKTDFVSYLEINSNISGAEIQFLNETLVEAFRAYPNSEAEQSKILYIISSDDSLDSFLTPLTESITFSFIYCNCVYSDNLVHYYSKLFMPDVPDADFDTEDYIQHIESNSNISLNDIAFLNSVIVEVSQAFPSSSNEDLQRVLYVTSSSDLLVPFLNDYTEQAVEVIENICSEPQLSIDDLNLTDKIQVIPNPIVHNFEILIDDNISIDKLIVYDVYGKILTEKFIINKNLMTKSDFKLNSGLYFFKFYSNKKTTTKKIIVK